MEEGHHDLVICNGSQWSASLLKDSYRFSPCPRCMADNIEVIPVEDHEKYSLSINKVRGFDVNLARTGLSLQVILGNIGLLRNMLSSE